MKGTIGQPKFKREDLVTFTISTDQQEVTIHGDIYVVDAFGIPGQNQEPSYDIEALYNGEVVLFKHIPESQVSPRSEL